MIIGSVDKTAETQVEKGLDDRNCTHYNIVCIYNRVKTMMETVSRRIFR